MAKNAGAIELSLEFPELTELRQQFRDLPKNIAAKHLGAALRIAMKPAISALKKNTPKGPTGNLRKSVKFKSKLYKKDGNAVGLVGYSWGGDDKGYHQGFLEFGTAERFTKQGRFASSWARSTVINRKKIERKELPARGFKIINARRGRNAGKLTTSPRPPKGFFKSAPIGERVSLGRVRRGGSTGKPPVKTTFNETRPQMVSLLRGELATRLEKALAEVKGRAARGLIT